ncbi:type II toxin-antitoxin system HicB family antitoxin [Labrys sp. KNU-23]|uniref:type II toxin-antitoxin system HicB family antitoxin n=1 Tax=Labrys sp. KNU-23 TaxID=2789216 RepID=UPI0011EC24DE|nr:type II toxin-antitoxin system HicB family antitoxin [Labrys sp. KNU-23]QEN86583.1 type II toxin-antitoxin system HicB family antitoxin [Labrys sp. KNU-23]
MSDLEYPILVEPRPAADGGGFAAIVPDLPGCMSNAETPEGAVAKAQDAIHAWIENSKNLGHVIPRPSRHHMAIWAALKTA